MERIHLMASEMSLENVNGRRSVGWTPDVSIYYKLTLFEKTSFEKTSFEETF